MWYWESEAATRPDDEDPYPFTGGGSDSDESSTTDGSQTEEDELEWLGQELPSDADYDDYYDYADKRRGRPAADGGGRPPPCHLREQRGLRNP